jgi:hypothetical protein
MGPKAKAHWSETTRAKDLTIHQHLSLLQTKTLESLSQEDMKDLANIISSLASRLAVRFTNDCK